VVSITGRRGDWGLPRALYRVFLKDLYSGIPKVTVCRVLRKRLNLKAYLFIQVSRAQCLVEHRHSFAATLKVILPDPVNGSSCVHFKTEQVSTRASRSVNELQNGVADVMRVGRGWVSMLRARSQEKRGLCTE
jgi:hypothetical protein